MLKLAFIADTHHYSKTLGTTGKQYELRSGSDQKCLAESGDIIDAAFEKLAESDVDYVLIAGDVTNDGERVSHLEFRDKLMKLSEKKKVYLITATHDWCNDLNPRRYDGDRVYHDVGVMSSRELPNFYRKFGVDDAISTFETHIGTCSYVVQLSDKVRLLALNDDKNEKNHAGFTEEHFQWIEQQLEAARQDGCLMIGMEHHLLIPHISPLITGGSTCVADREYVASRLADAGLRHMFVGHSHIQNTAEFKSKAGNVIREVNVGSLVGYPAPIVYVTVNDNMTLRCDVEHLEKFTFNGREMDAQAYLREHTLAIVHRLLEADDASAFAERAAALGLNSEKLGRFYPIIKPVIRFIRCGTVGEFYGRLKFLGLSRFVDKRLVERFANEKVMSFVDRIMLSAFDGSMVKYGKYDDYYKLVISFVSIPSRLFKKNEDLKNLVSAVDAILTGGDFDNQHALI